MKYKIVYATSADQYSAEHMVHMTPACNLASNITRHQASGHVIIRVELVEAS